MWTLTALQNYNQTRHDYEIMLEPNSIVELCEDDTSAIPRMQYHVRLVLWFSVLGFRVACNRPDHLPAYMQ